MALDANRATFVQTEYRYSELSDATVQAQQSTATTLEVTTNTSVAGADALATELLTDLKRPAKLYSITIAGIDTIDARSFDGSPPLISTLLAGFANQTQRVRSVEINFSTFESVITARG